MSSNPIIDSDSPLTPSDAVAAILILDCGRYLLQHRDSLPNIFYPDHWGFFGGGSEEGESELETLIRELKEELGFTFNPETAVYFTRFDFDFGFAGHKTLKRVYYEVPVRSEWLGQFKIGEGQGVKAFGGNEVLSTLKLTPYDSYALWLHHHRRRLAF